MLAGEVVVTYADGTAETCTADDLFYWPPGHSVRVLDDAESSSSAHRSSTRL
jgi:uncharacterized cupin superfamily protein